MCHPSWGRARAHAQHLRDLARLRRVRDRIDREHAQPLNVEALARGVNMAAGHLSRQFRSAYGESPYSYLMKRRIERAMALRRLTDAVAETPPRVVEPVNGPVRNREAGVSELQLA
jgi:AraC-like DNA-binding protein